MGLKPKDLYKISFQEFIQQNQDLKKSSKEIQTQRYNFFEEERKNNIKRCIKERNELIALTKKSKTKLKKNSSFEKSDLSNNIDLINESNSNLRKSNNSIGNKINNYKIISEKNKKIIMTENSYMMSNRDGSKTLLTKDDLDKITCLQKEKSKLEKKTEEKEEYLMRFLKSEINRQKKLQKMKNRINEKEKKINKFLKEKNDNLKLIENGRFQDSQDIYERQKLYEKMLDNYEKKIYLTKKQFQEKNTNINNKISNDDKMEELKEQIKDFERKNNKYKQKISNLFDLKEKQGIEDNKIRDKKFDINNPDLGTRKLIDLEQKVELERFRRENALMTNMNKFQNKINNILEKKEEKEKKIQKTIKEEEKKREEKRMLQSIHFEEVRNNVKKNQKKLEKERNLKIQDIEKRDLRDFAIKQEKIKMYEERKKMNQQSYEERKAIREKIKELFKDKKGIVNDEVIINKVLNN